MGCKAAGANYKTHGAFVSSLYVCAQAWRSLNKKLQTLTNPQFTRVTAMTKVLCKMLVVKMNLPFILQDQNNNFYF